MRPARPRRWSAGRRPRCARCCCCWRSPPARLGSAAKVGERSSGAARHVGLLGHRRVEPPPAEGSAGRAGRGGRRRHAAPQGRSGCGAPRPGRDRRTQPPGFGDSAPLGDPVFVPGVFPILSEEYLEVGSGKARSPRQVCSLRRQPAVYPPGPGGPAQPSAPPHLQRAGTLRADPAVLPFTPLPSPPKPGPAVTPERPHLKIRIVYEPR